jgi:signal transduction histidine kinase
MRQIIADFLDISAIEAGKLELHMQPTDRVSLAGANLQRQVALARQRNIRIESRFEADTLLCRCDAGKSSRCSTT